MIVIKVLLILFAGSASIPNIARAFVLLHGYNRIHMTNHFLTDVCFDMMITYLIYAGISAAFLHAAKE